jgi:hypothetical protein
VTHRTREPEDSPSLAGGVRVDFVSDSDNPQRLERDMDQQQKPTVGRIVHYVMPNGRSKGETRPAIVVRVWQPCGEAMPLVQLQVFTDGSNDGPEYASGLAWKTSVHYDSEGAPDSWRWPPRA